MPLCSGCEVGPTLPIKAIAIDFLLLFIIPKHPIASYIGTEEVAFEVHVVGSKAKALSAGNQLSPLDALGIQTIFLKHKEPFIDHIEGLGALRHQLGILNGARGGLFDAPRALGGLCYGTDT